MARLMRITLAFELLTVIALLAGSADAATCYKFLSKDDYPNCLQLDSNLVLHWRTLDNTTLELAPDGDGYFSWLAIGISGMGMKGVDYNMVIRGTQGLSWVTGDYFTNNGTTPTLDQEQNAVLTTTPDFNRDNHTLAIWERPLDSCDTEDIPVYFNVERSLIWAYSYKTNWEIDKLSFSQFVKGIIPGVRFFNSTSSSLFNATTATTNVSSATDPNAITATFAMPAYPIQANDASVVCVNLALPNAAPYHVIAYQGFNTTPFVARLSGYMCAPGVVLAVAPGVPYKCGPSPSVLPAGCETLNFIWAPGAGPFTAPPEAGFAIGAGAATRMVLQVHYSSAMGTVGKTDSSGFNLTYTSTLRSAALGVLTLGNTDMRIPPATERFTALPNICPAACTARRVLAPVTLVSNFYMMGSMGLSTLTRHIRDGAAIQPVGRIDYWEMGRALYQTTFPESRTLLPNDTIISLCSYNSTGVSRLTTYGDNPGQELCFNFVTFFPLSAMPDLDYCIADTRRNVSTCATRSKLAALEAAGVLNAEQLANGTKLPVVPLNISFFKSSECMLHDMVDVTPYHAPNTRAAVASVVLVPIVLILVGTIIYTKYSKQEEMEALVQRARQEGLDMTFVE